MVGTPQASSKGKPGLLSDLDFSIGDEALGKAVTHSLTYPLRHGMVSVPAFPCCALDGNLHRKPNQKAVPLFRQVEDWERMEQYWHKSISEYLRIDSEDHNFVLTEPPLNTPENRELTAEIMFETFGVPGLYIGMQAVLALYASFAAAEKSNMVGHALLPLAKLDSPGDLAILKPGLCQGCRAGSS